MKVTSVEFRKTNGKSSIKYFANIRLDGLLELRGFKIIDGKNGLFVAPPSEKSLKPDTDGNYQWYDTIRFNTESEEGKEFKNNFSDFILSELKEQGYSASSGQAKSAPKTIDKSKGDVPW